MKDHPIFWLGDLDDDCSAVYRGYMLRAEDMGQGWWWAVSGPRDEIEDCCERSGQLAADGPAARAAAEKAVRRYIATHGPQSPAERYRAKLRKIGRLYRDALVELRERRLMDDCCLYCGQGGNWTGPCPNCGGTWS